MTTRIDLELYDDVEVMPVYEDPDEGCCEPVLESGEPISFWTVCGHRKEGGVTALVDCVDQHSAGIAASSPGRRPPAVCWQRRPKPPRAALPCGARAGALPSC